jgi:plastocyanin
MQAILAVLLALAPLGRAMPGESPYPGGFFGQDETTDVSVQDFRFCIRVCRGDGMAYVRTPEGPVAGSDNPRAVVYMQPGARFTWTYRDEGCDVLRCGGHDIRIEDGTADGRPIGRVSAEPGHDTLSWTIPADARPESIIRYFCARHASFGMTGAFQVLPIRVLSVSYPPPQPPEPSAAA